VSKTSLLDIIKHYRKSNIPTYCTELQLKYHEIASSTEGIKRKKKKNQGRCLQTEYLGECMAVRRSCNRRVLIIT
jgi:hypothetical protein